MQTAKLDYEFKILKPKEGKRINVLNFYIRETLQSDLQSAIELISRNYDDKILVKFKVDKKIPSGYEIEYFNIDKYEITTIEMNELSKQNRNAVPKEHTFYSLSKKTMSALAI